MSVCVRARHESGARKALGDEVLQQVEQTDLMTYGLIPEFVGRFPIITALHVSAPHTWPLLIFCLGTPNSVRQHHSPTCECPCIRPTHTFWLGTCELIWDQHRRLLHATRPLPWCSQLHWCDSQQASLSCKNVLCCKDVQCLFALLDVLPSTWVPSTWVPSTWGPSVPFITCRFSSPCLQPGKACCVLMPYSCRKVFCILVGTVLVIVQEYLELDQLS